MTRAWEGLAFLDEIIKDERVEGVLSHLSSPLDRDFSLLQIERFERIVKIYNHIKYIHMESSAGMVYREGKGCKGVKGRLY